MKGNIASRGSMEFFYPLKDGVLLFIYISLQSTSIRAMECSSDEISDMHWHGSPFLNRGIVKRIPSIRFLPDRKRSEAERAKYFFVLQITMKAEERDADIPKDVWGYMYVCELV